MQTFLVRGTTAVGNIQAVGANGFPGPALLRAQNAGMNYVHTFSPA